MNRGNQVVAPNGFLALEKDKRYVFLGCSDDAGHATFVEFTTQRKGGRVHIHRVPLKQFEYAITAGIDKIIKAPSQRSLPPWLERYEGSSVENIDARRKYFKSSHNDACRKRHGFIADLLPRLPEVLNAKNPFTITNAHAKVCHPKQNRTRLAEWFFSFVCFGDDRLALLGDLGKNGTWSRTDDAHINGHYGRENLAKGRDAGSASALCADQIVRSYKNRAKRGVTMTQIYRDALVEDFGCRARKVGDRFELYQPEGKPFPDTYGKFRYQVLKVFSAREVQKTLYGVHHTRNRSAAKGSYSENLANALQQGEADGYYVSERPSIPLSNIAGARLCVVRGVCTVSKYTFGVGFSHESESAEAYNGMLFSAAIGIEKYAVYFGLKGAILPTVSQGLPSKIVIDRGAAAVSAMNRLEAAVFPVREMTETYAGRSKPNVEGGHPRDLNVDGPPKHVVSHLNVIQMVKREICRAAKDNHSSTISDLQNGIGQGNFEGRSPAQIFEELDRRGRNDAIQISFESAVRRFLTRRTLELKDGGVWYLDKRFGSDDLSNTETFLSMRKGQTIMVTVYTLSMCLTYLWVDLGGRLLELNVMHHAFQKANEEHVAEAEMAAVREANRRANAIQRDSSVAADVEAQALFREATGKDWSAGEQRNGAPKNKTPEAQLEKQALKGVQSRSRAA